MRHGPELRASLSALTLLGVMLTTLAPTAAAATAATERSTIGVAIDVTKDGNGLFTPTDEPGGDTGATNGIVRTMDAVTYRVSVNSNDGSSTNERFTVTAPAGTKWAGLPSTCTGPGSAIDGTELTCNIGTLAEGKTVFVPVVLNVSGDLQNGDELAVTATATADDAENGGISATSETTTVSAAARYNLSKDVHGSILRTGVSGPDGRTEGVQLIYPIAVDWQPLVPEQGLLGFEKSVGPMTFEDDLSRILGAVPSGAVLWNGGNPVCGPNAKTDWRMGALPGGVGGGATAVVDSGDIRCTQAGPGQNVHVAITDTVTDPTRIPSKSLTNGPISGGAKAYVVSGFISLWMPNPPTGTSVDSINTYTPLQTTSASGAPNFPGGSEPTGDNSARRNILEFAPGGAAKRLLRVIGDGESVVHGSAQQGDPWTTPGSLLRSDVSAWNRGLSPFEDVILCDTFDRGTQHVTRVGAKRVAAWTSGLSNAKLQYAAYDMTSPAAGQQATCDDADGPWYEQPEDVPGGVDAVGAIRATGDVLGGVTAGLFSYVTTEEAPDRTRVHDFGHVWFGDRQPGWRHDATDPDLGAGPLSDSVVITQNLARIQKKVVDPGHDADDTPDETSFAVAGATIDYALYPSLTNGHASGRPTEVVVRDVLPTATTYVPGSASKTPEIDTTTDEDGNRVQRLTWTSTVAPNTPIEPITYSASVSGSATTGSVVNTAAIASPTDQSPDELREAARAVQIVTTGGVGVEKHAVHPVVVAGDHLEWELGYTNTDATAIDGIDVIDVLPFRGDNRNSSFHGSAGLAAPVAVDATAGETVRYTDRTPGDVALDSTDPSNQNGGTTRWCTEAELGTEGCAASLADVTAFRIQRTSPVGVGQSVSHEVAVATTGERDGDTYTNRFGLRASNLALPVVSNPASVRVVAGALGDRVWSDEDADGLQDDGEPGIGGVPVELTGTDDRGAGVERTTTTDAGGTYGFDGLRPGTYRVHWTAPDGREFTEEHVGDDRSIDSDADAGGRSEPIALAPVQDAEGNLDGVDRDDTTDAGVLPEPETPVVPPVEPPVTPPVTPENPGTPETPGAAGPGGVTPPSGSEHQPNGPSSTGQRTTAASGTRSALAFTGTAGLQVAAVTAAVLLVLGAGTILVRRRRRDQQHDQ